MYLSCVVYRECYVTVLRDRSVFLKGKFGLGLNLMAGYNKAKMR